MNPRVLTLGESMGLIRTDGVGDFTDAATAVLDTAGSEGNVAIGLARYGLPVTWLGRVGDDAWGRRVIGDLRSQGVEIQVIVDPGAPTGVMFKATPRRGTTSVTYHRAGSAGSRLTVDDLDRIDVTDYRLVHLTGITPALSESAALAALTVARRARDAGVTLSFDVNYRSKLWTPDAARPALRELAMIADVLIAGEDEARLLTGPTATTTECLTLLHGLGPTQVVLKKGAEGAVVSAAGEIVDVPAVPVAVVDTVGAGDSFTAVYLAEMLEGAPLRIRMERAAFAGALACAHPGDWRGGPTRAEVLEIRSGADPVSR